uniref:Uncharacterized protein n=1 Tax=Rhizophora mucronata TaxID=61149 RepID=A0A2P2PC00_RHIMU
MSKEKWKSSFMFLLQSLEKIRGLLNIDCIFI